MVKKKQAIKRLVLYVVLIAAVSFATFGSVPSAQASGNLCDGFTDCLNKGYSTHRYDNHYTNSYWGAASGHNCTNYASYMLSMVNGVSQPSSPMGNGEDWDDTIRAKYPNDSSKVNDFPAVGAIAQWEHHATNHPGGHVAYVEGVSVSGTTITITISDDTWGGDFRWKTISEDDTDWPDDFIHLNDLMDAPSMHTASNGDIWLAAVNRQGELYTRKYKASTSSWGSVLLHSNGWSAKSSPSITLDNAGRAWVAGVKLNGTLYAKYFDTSWHTIEVDDKVSIDAGVSLVPRTNGNVSMAYVKQTGGLYHGTVSTSGKATGSHGASWSTTSMPAITVDTSGTMWMAGVKTNGNLDVFRIGSSGDIAHPSNLTGFSVRGGLDMVARSNGNVTLVAIAQNGDFYHYTLSTTGSSGGTHSIDDWSTLHSPSVTVDSADRLWIAAIKSDHNAYSYVYDSGWTQRYIGGDYFKSSGLSIEPRTNGTVSVAGVNDSKQITHRTWSWTDDAWGAAMVHGFN